MFMWFFTAWPEKRSRWLCGLMCAQLAPLFEAGWRRMGAPSNAVQHAHHQLHRRGDPALRRQVATRARTFISAARLSKASVELGKPLGAVHPYQKEFEARQYYEAAFSHFKSCKRLAITCDGARLGKRSRLAGISMNLDTSLVAWNPPQAPPSSV